MNVNVGVKVMLTAVGKATRTAVGIVVNEVMMVTMKAMVKIMVPTGMTAMAVVAASAKTGR